LQGVKINDKPSKSSCGQMLRKIEVWMGDSALLRGEQMDRGRVLDVIAKQKSEGKHQSTWEPSFGDHQGVFGDSRYLRSFVPGNDARPYRGGGSRVEGRPARFEGKRHCGRFDPRGARFAYHARRRRAFDDTRRSSFML